MEVPLLLDVGASDACVVVVLDGASLGRKPVDHGERQSWMTLTDVLVAVASQRRRVSTVPTFIWLQTLTHSSVSQCQIPFSCLPFNLDSSCPPQMLRGYTIYDTVL